MKLAVRVLAVSASLSGCGGDGAPAGPSGDSGVRIILSVQSFGRTISRSVAGQTISATGTLEIRVPAGTQTMNGSFNPNEQVVPQLAISVIGHPEVGAEFAPGRSVV